MINTEGYNFYIYNMNSYVYVYLDTRVPGRFIYGELEFEYEPFYVGKGHGDRAYSHITEKKIINVHKTGKINKIVESGLLPKIVFLYENIDDTDAKKFEIDVIEKIGRYPSGPLTNMTDGGDGSLGLIRSFESIEKQKESIKNNKEWLSKMKSLEFSNKMSEIKIDYYSDDENRVKVSERQMGCGNSMYGKVTSDRQKESVREAHRQGKIKLSDSGRESLRASAILRKGSKNSNIRSDIKKYTLVSPSSEEFIVYGGVSLQRFCAERKLQLYVLKNNINTTITKDKTIGNKIFAKNTIGWTLKN